jgi:SH3 domain-containing YSC84-like protein 1
MRIATLFLIASLLAVPALAGTGTTATHRTTKSNSETRWLQEAQGVLVTSANAPDKGIPRSLLEKAECVGVFPAVTKGAFLMGGEYGRGVFTCREPDGNMGAPAFFTIGGGSFGWQFGGSQTDLVLLVMNKDGMRHLLSDKFTLGAEATAAAGPVGRTAKAATDAQMHAEILSWSRSRGLIVGASLSGTVIKPDANATKEFYGKPMTASEVLAGQSVPMPKAAQAFVKTTDTYTRHS